MQKGGLTADGGRGRLTIQKVRLMHATIRRLAPTAPTWKNDFGLPVNQEDLVGTMLAFSWIAVDGLEKIGVELTDDDREAYVHCWNVVGHLLGIRDDLLPISAPRRKPSPWAIAAHQFGPTTDGQNLTSALIGMLVKMLPGDVFDPVPRLMIRYFLGQQWAQWLGVEDGFSCGSGGRAAAARRHSPLAARSRFKNHVRDSRESRSGRDRFHRVRCARRKPAKLAIPLELRQQWGVNWTS